MANKKKEMQIAKEDDVLSNNQNIADKNKEIEELKEQLLLLKEEKKEMQKRYEDLLTKSEKIITGKNKHDDYIYYYYPPENQLYAGKEGTINIDNKKYKVKIHSDELAKRSYKEEKLDITGDIIHKIKKTQYLKVLNINNAITDDLIYICKLSGIIEDTCEEI